MTRLLLRSKIHRARVTALRLDYEGSLTLDRALMDAAGLVPFEQVHVLNLNNGTRFETYVIPGRRGSGAVELNGPAARLGAARDEVIVLAYGIAGEREVARPRIVRPGPGNRLPRVRRRAR